MGKQHLKLNIFWFRRDLRLEDNSGLYYALKSGIPVLPVFIFDTDILDKLDDRSDRRVEFIYNAVSELDKELISLGSSLLILHGKPLDTWKKLTQEYKISAVYTNHDYEPYALRRDDDIRNFLLASGIQFYSYKDQVIFEKDEVTKSDGSPYTIYTPYSRVWRTKLNGFYTKSYPVKKYSGNFYKTGPFKNPTLGQIGFKSKTFDFPSKALRKNIIKDYHNVRDIPSIEGTSRLSVHLRFGTVSIRKLVQQAQKLNDTWLGELIWREFFMMILYYFPHSAENSFKPEYDLIKWRNNEDEFAAWCEGRTGFPIVDAGMSELNSTGYMHNRVRMITASFFAKDLLIDWRWGERYFANKLLDYEMSSNVGNWQWAAGTGCDAAPYFRIFNPSAQAEKFDPENKYIKKWVPEYGTPAYPKPIVEHSFARERTLKAYKSALDVAKNTDKPLND